jgi:K+-sensing histidine kinase KdpD
VIEGWLETLRAGRPIPPPVVVSAWNGRFYTHDGNHRLLALREFLGPEATITVAQAVPLQGFAFERIEESDYYTYQLRNTGWVPKVAKYMVPPAVASASITFAYALHDPGATPLLALFCIAVVLTALYWGMRSAALLTLITLGVAAYLTDPVNSLLVTNLSHLIEIVLTGLGMLWVSYLISKGNWRAQ